MYKCVYNILQNIKVDSGFNILSLFFKSLKKFFLYLKNIICGRIFSLCLIWKKMLLTYINYLLTLMKIMLCLKRFVRKNFNDSKKVILISMTKIMVNCYKNFKTMNCKICLKFKSNILNATTTQFKLSTKPCKKYKTTRMG